MSRFNTQLCCVSCLLREQAHPRFPEALAAEEDAVRRGDMNFPGVGLPQDLEPSRGGEADEIRKSSTWNDTP
jgi:hypothetical protein